MKRFYFPARRATIGLGACAVIVTTTLVTGSAAGQWTFVSLHPPGAFESKALGVDGNQQVGYVRPTEAEPFNAVLWSGTAASLVTLSSDGATAYDVGGGTQVGRAAAQAVLWTGTPASMVSLQPVGVTDTTAFDVAGNQRVGRAKVGSFFQAALWNGSNPNFINLNPDGAATSEALGVRNGKQAGFVRIGVVFRAALWSGTASSFVDLNPAGMSPSYALATDGSQQGGLVTIQASGITHAALWSGTAASFVDLHPAVSTGNSQVNSLANGLQAGFVTIGGNQRAALWSAPGGAGSFVNLHSFLPSSFSTSVAEDISIDATGMRRIVGWGVSFDGMEFHTQAVMWRMQGPPPPPDPDLNDDGHVNGLDVAILLGQWTGAALYAPCPPFRPADLNQDCRVNGLDLATMLGAWTG